MSEFQRPAGLNLAPPQQALRETAKKRSDLLRSMISSTAQTANIDNFTVLPIDQLQAFRDHPFLVKNDEELEELAESIKKVGVLSPILVRAIEDDCYEIIAGHRRTEAARKAGLEDIPAKILNVDDDLAVIIMTDTNLKQRERILPSEKARAYQMQMKAFEHKWGVRAGQTVADNNSEKKRDVFRYLRLNYLLPDLLEMVDNDDLIFRAAVELSYLDSKDQEIILDCFSNGAIKSLTTKEAEAIKNLALNHEEFTSGSLSIKFGKATDQADKENRTDNFKVFQSAAKHVSKHFKNVKFEGISPDQEELERVMIAAVDAYIAKKQREFDSK